MPLLHRVSCFLPTGDPENRMAQRKLTFGLLDSRMFNEFDGEWRMQFNSRKVWRVPVPDSVSVFFFQRYPGPKTLGHVMRLKYSVMTFPAIFVFRGKGNPHV